MILIDVNEETDLKKKKNLELIPHIQKLGVSVEKSALEYGDAAFEGMSPQGSILIGVERKRLHDMLNCIDDSRYTGHQRIGMAQMYGVSILIIEGHWRPHDTGGFLMEGFSGGYTWGFCKNKSQRVMYSKLYRYLVSVALSGVIITYSRDPFHTAFNIVELFHYFQKRDHTALMEMQKFNIPTLNMKPTLTRKWANDLEGIGTKISALAERNFKSPLALANADESEWLRIPGVGVKTAQSIVREIWGTKR